jgi:hypothetical protein
LTDECLQRTVIREDCGPLATSLWTGVPVGVVDHAGTESGFDSLAVAEIRSPFRLCCGAFAKLTSDKSSDRFLAS